MKQKKEKGYTLIRLLLLLFVVATAVLLLFMPDSIPAHYNVAGEADRFGSKYENLLWPALAFLLGGCVLFFARRLRKQGNAGMEKVLLYTGSCVLLFFLL